MTFERWVAWLFSDPEAWSRSRDEGCREPTPQRSLEHMIRLFEGCDLLLNGYSNQQATDGLYRILQYAKSARSGCVR